MQRVLLTLFLPATFLFPTNAQGGDESTGFKVTCDPPLVVTSVGRDVNLTCHVKPPKDLSDRTVKLTVKVQWDKGAINVHYRSKGKDDDDFQHDHFKNRTKLHGEGLSDGNISLTIFNISAKDEGNYTCSVTIWIGENAPPKPETSTVKLVVNLGSSDDKRKNSAETEPTVKPTDDPPKDNKVAIASGVTILIVLAAVLAGVLFYLCRTDRLHCPRDHQPVPNNPPNPQEDIELNERGI